MYKVIGVDQKEYGPATLDQVRQWIADRRLIGQSQTQVVGSAEWRPLSSFPEFDTALKAAMPSPASYPSSLPVTQPRSNNGMAVAGFVLGLLSLLCCGPLFGVIGLALSAAALFQINKNPDQPGRGLAIAGLILSAIGLILFLILMVMGTFAEMFERFFH